MLERMRSWMRRAPKGEVIYRGREIVVFQRDGYQGFAFKGRPNLIQGWQSLSEPLDFRGEFVEMQLATTMCLSRPRRVAVLGLGLGTVPRSLRSIYPQVVVEAVEIRPEVVDVARRYFGLAQDEKFSVSVCDAGDWVARAPSSRFDAVYVDLYADKGMSELVSSSEFMANLSRILRPGGLLSFNLIRGRQANARIASLMSGVTRSSWIINGIRKSNQALFGLKAGRIDPGLCLQRAKRVDRRNILPFRVNGHVRRMQRLYSDMLER